MTNIDNPKIELIAVKGLPEIKGGDDLSELLLDEFIRLNINLQEKDILVIAQKIVSKAEERIVDLDKVKPSSYAEKIGGELLKDPKIVEVVLGETKRIVKMQRKVDTGVLIVENKDGLVLANAGVDASNVSGGNTVTLLPEDSDSSA